MLGLLCAMVSWEIDVWSGAYIYDGSTKNIPAMDTDRFTCFKTQFLRWGIVVTTLCAVVLHARRFAYRFEWARDHKHFR